MLDFSETVAEIDKLVKTKQSGALFIVSNNRLARMYVRSGEISSLAYNRKTGIEALTELKQVIQAKVGYHNGQNAPIDESLPDTDSIMTFLREGMGDLFLKRSYFKVDAPQELLDKIKGAYVAVIGPIGEVLFEDSLKESKDLPFLVTSLRRQMETDADVSEFNRNLELADIWPE
ncbi:hypothetical protein [Leucothrix arctica]|uniref:DUF8082 domain-containing protein n=1 Tax=Leucothrix arctica TaxID=1481894 RepID=A0A317CKS8_9GAMM|nr:hypothetical protein [Leucothrix arctica]PWQ96942.1 hypothetical protein DKT75_07845 [Leucothrix arctica]